MIHVLRSALFQRSSPSSSICDLLRPGGRQVADFGEPAWRQRAHGQVLRRREAGRGQAARFPDSYIVGLEFRVSGDGRKTWTYRYRTRMGRQGRITLGLFSDTFDLEKARREAAKARVLVDDGGDPAEALREAKRKAQAEPIRTFDDLAEAYSSHRERSLPRQRAGEACVEPHQRTQRLPPAHQAELGKLRPEMVTRATVRATLEDMLDAGVTSQANKAQAIIRQMLTFAVDDRERLRSIRSSECRPLRPSSAVSHLHRR